MSIGLGKWSFHHTVVSSFVLCGFGVQEITLEMSFF